MSQGKVHSTQTTIIILCSAHAPFEIVFLSLFGIPKLHVFLLRIRVACDSRWQCLFKRVVSFRANTHVQQLPLHILQRVIM